MAVGRMEKRLARHKLHDDVEHAVHFTEVVDADQVWVVEPCHAFGFGFEDRAEARILAELLGQDFDGDGAVERFLHGAIDRAHATRGDEAKKVPCPQFILMDYQLDFGENGITLYADLCEFWAVDIPAVLITANAEQSIRQQAQEAGMAYLRKPVKPAPLRATMTHLIRQNPLGDD